MGSLTIKQLDQRTLERLRARAARHGRSLGTEVRAILDAAVGVPEQNFLLALHASISDVGGGVLPLTPRQHPPRPVDLGIDDSAEVRHCGPARFSPPTQPT